MVDAKEEKKKAKIVSGIHQSSHNIDDVISVLACFCCFCCSAGEVREREREKSFSYSWPKKKFVALWIVRLLEVLA